MPSKKIAVDKDNMNFHINKALTDNGFEVIDKGNICENLKAVKNKV